jgi:hypothetical protein
MKLSFEVTQKQLVENLYENSLIILSRFVSSLSYTNKEDDTITVSSEEEMAATVEKEGNNDFLLTPITSVDIFITVDLMSKIIENNEALSLVNKETKGDNTVIVFSISEGFCSGMTFFTEFSALKGSLCALKIVPVSLLDPDSETETEFDIEFED